MKTFARLIIVALLGSFLIGCAALQRAENAYQAVTSATVSPQAIILAADSFDVVKITATNYLRTRRCTGSNGPICRDPGLTKTVIAPAIKTGTDARNSLKTFLRTHPNQLGDQGVYDALKGATSTLEAALATYSAATK